MRVFINFQGVDGDILWASISNNSLLSIASMLKQCEFQVTGKVGILSNLCFLFHYFCCFITRVQLDNIFFMCPMHYWRANSRMNLWLLEEFHFLRFSSSSLSPSVFWFCSFHFLTYKHNCYSQTKFIAHGIIIQVSLNTMESRIQRNLFFAGEVVLSFLDQFKSNHPSSLTYDDSLMFMPVFLFCRC